MLIVCFFTALQYNSGLLSFNVYILSNFVDSTFKYSDQYNEQEKFLIVDATNPSRFQFFEELPMCFRLEIEEWDDETDFSGIRETCKNFSLPIVSSLGTNSTPGCTSLTLLRHGIIQGKLDEKFISTNVSSTEEGSVIAVPPVTALFNLKCNRIYTDNKDNDVDYFGNRRYITPSSIITIFDKIMKVVITSTLDSPDDLPLFVVFPKSSHSKSVYLPFGQYFSFYETFHTREVSVIFSADNDDIPNIRVIVHNSINYYTDLPLQEKVSIIVENKKSDDYTLLKEESKSNNSVDYITLSCVLGVALLLLFLLASIWIINKNNSKINNNVMSNNGAEESCLVLNSESENSSINKEKIDQEIQVEIKNEVVKFHDLKKKSTQSHSTKDLDSSPSNANANACNLIPIPGHYLDFDDSEELEMFSC